MKKILVAEDDKYLADAYKLKLTKAGFDVLMASDGHETLEALKTFTPDLIILDMVMPVKDGFTTLEDLKKSEEWKDIPVIIASNLGQREDMMQLGAEDFVVKSDLKLEDLITKINTILAAKK